MNEIVQKIVELEKLSKTLEPNEEERNECFEQVKKYTSDFIGSLSSTKAFNSSEVDKSFFTVGKNTK